MKQAKESRTPPEQQMHLPKCPVAERPTLPKLEWFQTFIDVVDLGSYAAAGSKSEMNNSGAVKRVQNLTKSLSGLELFNPGSTKLTEDGKQILAHARRMIALQRDTCELARRLKEGVEGVVRIACYPAHIQAFLAKVVGKFKINNPLVRIEIAPIDHTGTVGRGNMDLLRDGLVDISVGALNEEFDGYKVYEAHLVIVVSDDDPLKQKKEVKIEELRAQPLLLGPANYFSRVEVDRACREAGFAPRIEVESSSWAALQALGKNKVGIAIVPNDTLPESVAPFPPLLNVKGKQIVKETWIQWQKGKSTSTAVERFKEAIAEFCRRNNPIAASTNRK